MSLVFLFSNMKDVRALCSLELGRERRLGSSCEMSAGYVAKAIWLLVDSELGGKKKNLDVSPVFVVTSGKTWILVYSRSNPTYLATFSSQGKKKRLNQKFVNLEARMKLHTRVAVWKNSNVTAHVDQCVP